MAIECLGGADWSYGEGKMLTMAQMNSARQLPFKKGLCYAGIARTTGFEMDDFNQPHSNKGAE